MAVYSPPHLKSALKQKKNQRDFQKKHYFTFLKQCQILRNLKMEYIINIFVITFQSFSYRHLFKHIIQSYLPTTIVVIISWLSFMIPPASFPGRSGLLSLLILCIMNIMLNIIGQSPLISGICGLTIWCIICLFMVTSFRIKHNLSFLKYLIQSIYRD